MNLWHYYYVSSGPKYPWPCNYHKMAAQVCRRTLLLELLPPACCLWEGLLLYHEEAWTWCPCLDKYLYGGIIWGCFCFMTKDYSSSRLLCLLISGKSGNISSQLSRQTVSVDVSYTPPESPAYIWFTAIASLFDMISQMRSFTSLSYTSWRSKSGDDTIAHERNAFVSPLLSSQ